MQVDYIAKTLVLPLLNGNATTVEVKKYAEDEFVAGIDEELSGTVFSSGCSNWYINNQGRNSASWPGAVATFWKRSFFPNWKHFVFRGGKRTWMIKRAYRGLSSVLLSKSSLLASLVLFGVLASNDTWQKKVKDLLIT